MIYFSDTPEQIDQKISGARHDPPVLCKNPTGINGRAVLTSLPGLSQIQGPVILTGHQPTFHHPGILIKNLLTAQIAKRVGGAAVHMVHDTDEEEVVFTYPNRIGSVVRKKHIRLNEPGKILMSEELTESSRANMLSVIRDLYPMSRMTFSPDWIPRIRESLDALSEITRTAARPMDVSDGFRKHWEKENKLQIYTIYSSDLFGTTAFQCFFQHIRENGDRFREVFNKLLHNYRITKGIKNPAQPFPDLKEHELPFWILEDGNRKPCLDESNVDSATVLPRAVTLTLFCRLFFCDLFIHGLGGERYDRITDEILKEFFGYDGAPFTAASATLSLSPRFCLPIHGRKAPEVERDLRALEFDPTRFLEKTNPVRKTKEELLKKRLVESADRKSIHRELMKVNHNAREVLAGCKQELESEARAAEITTLNNDFFSSRDLPFFYYDLAPLISATKPYGQITRTQLLENKSPRASLAEARS